MRARSPSSKAAGQTSAVVRVERAERQVEVVHPRMRDSEPHDGDVESAASVLERLLLRARPVPDDERAGERERVTGLEERAAPRPSSDERRDAKPAPVNQARARLGLHPPLGVAHVRQRDPGAGPRR